jgi:benzaldehyde dehydrogenase (NAD)
MIEQKMLIAGQECAAGNGATFERKNPLDGSVATRAPAATTEDAIRACDAAAAAFPAWSQLGPNARRAMLMKASQALEAKGEAIAAAMAAETGASGIWAGFNVHLAASMLLEGGFADHADQWRDHSLRRARQRGHGRAPARRRGAGHRALECPVILAVRSISTALACGNTVILKGSELCPATHGLIIEALQDAGLPAGVVNFVTNAPADAGSVVEAIVAHPAVRRVSFTGSTRWAASSARPAPGISSPRCWSSAARPPSWCSTMPISMRP